MENYDKIKQLKSKVEDVLIKYPETRNSDVILTFMIIKEYLPNEIKEIDDKFFISTFALKRVREDNVKRIRAKFNEKGKYLATDPEVLKKRITNQEDWRKFVGANPELREV